MVEEKKEKKTSVSWVKIKPEDLKKLIVDLAKKGEAPAKIGLILRDKHGIPKTKLLGKKISEILREAGVEFMGQKEIMEGNVEKLKGHLVKNKHDHTASRSLAKKLWTVRRLAK